MSGAFAALLITRPPHPLQARRAAANLLHFAYNSLALLHFGPALENALGSPRFLAVYLGAGGQRRRRQLRAHHPVLSVGASGAIFGLGLGAVTPHVDVAAYLGGLMAGLAAMALLDVGFARRRPWLPAAGLAAPVMLFGRAGRRRHGDLHAVQRVLALPDEAAVTLACVLVCGLACGAPPSRCR